MTSVDLGCGTKKRGDVGVDVVALPGVDHVVNLGFERLPFENDSIDAFTAFDFVEHVPMAAYVEREGRIVTLRPQIFLWNEIYRCLRTGGTWKHVTPSYPAHECWQDPTHVTVWTEASGRYFSNDPAYAVLQESYGISARFRPLSQTRSYDSDARFPAYLTEMYVK